MPKTISSLPTGAINKTDSIITATDGSDELKRNTVDELLAEPTAEIEALRAQIAEMEEEISELNSDLNYEASGELTPSSEYTIPQNACYRKGNVVNFVLRSTDCSINGTETFASLPEGFRPSTTVYAFGAAYYNDQWNPILFRITSAGNVSQVVTNYTITRLMLAGSFPI